MTTMAPKTEFETKNFNDRPPRSLDAKKPGLQLPNRNNTKDQLKEFNGVDQTGPLGKTL